MRLGSTWVAASIGLIGESSLLADPDYWTQCWMMTAVWARKPDERG